MFDPSMYHRLGEKLHEVYSHGVTRTTSLTNPYTPQLALLQDELYRDPTPGFQTRIIILFIINGLVVLLGMVYLTLLIIDVKRKGRTWWFFRLVQRPSGRYIATNQGAFLAISSITSTVIIIGHLSNEYTVILYDGSQANTAAWRSLSWIPLFVNSWMISWASLQSFLLTPDQHNKHLLTAAVANWLFVGVGTFLTVLMLIGGLMTTYAGNHVWVGFVAIRDTLMSYEASWTAGGVDIAAFLTLSSQANTLIADSNQYRAFSTGLAIILVFVPFSLAVINLGALGLARVLRRQINFNLLQFRKPSLCPTSIDRINPNDSDPDITSQNTTPTSLQSPESIPLEIITEEESSGKTKSFKSWGRKSSIATSAASNEDTIAAKGKSKSGTVQSEGMSSTTKLKSFNILKSGEGECATETVTGFPTRAEIRHIASSGTRSGVESEQAKRIMILQRAERDLVVVGCMILTLSVIVAGIIIWLAVGVSQNALTNAPWPVYETALFLVEWLYAIVLLIALAFLISNSFAHLARPASEANQITYVTGSSTHPNGHGGTTQGASMASFGAMFRRTGGQGSGIGERSMEFTNPFPTAPLRTSQPMKEKEIVRTIHFPTRMVSRNDGGEEEKRIGLDGTSVIHEIDDVVSEDD